jgi:hypothetical protein
MNVSSGVARHQHFEWNVDARASGGVLGKRCRAGCCGIHFLDWAG